jgi:uncharacterized protein YndB with AHSA1/START domain
MAEFEREKQMPADAERVFDVAADVEHLDRWLPDMVSVHPSGAQAVDVDVHRPEGEHHGTGTLGVHRDQLRMEWGRRGSADYAGWLQVAHAGGGRSSVTLHLSFLGDQPESHGGDAAAGIERRLDDALDRLAGLVAAGT